MSPRLRGAASVALLALLWLALSWPALRCLGGCYYDYTAIREGGLGRLEPSDARLNSWILGWVQRSLLHDPAALYDGNIFYPARRVITQSEHLIGEALQTLPVRALGGDAVALHQAALLLSGLLLALTTYALVRWLVGSEFAAFAAGAVSLAMPWRLAELSHVQILSAQWFPLIWLQTARIASGESSPRHVALLAAVLALQLLSSFYLAYYLVASLGLLLLALWLCFGMSLRTALALAAGLLPPALLFLFTALPYLGWSSAVGFQGPRPLESIAAADVLARTAPRLELGWRGSLPLQADVSYEVPLAVFALALVGLAWGWRAFPFETRRRCRALALGLGALCALSWVLALGRGELALGAWRLPLPGDLAARFVPGYENLRNPLRWAVPIGIAAPVLAAIGIARLERALATRAARRVLRAGVALLLLASMPWVRLPVRDAWEGQEDRLAAYAALRDLEPGVVLEVPWPLPSAASVDVVSRYVLASTLHWRPLVNGVSGYVPPSAHLLRQAAQDLPAQRALRRLHDLGGVRFIVVHADALPRPAIAAWAQALREKRVRRVWSDDSTWIVELPDFERPPRHLEALASPEPRSRTLAGLPRTALQLGDPAGSLALREERRPFLFAPGATRPLRIELENASGAWWPGFDVQPEGLVHVRYAFRDERGDVVAELSTPLGEDVRPRSRVSLAVPVRPPITPGAYRLELSLVQSLEGQERSLPVPPLALDVEVRAIRPRAARGRGARAAKLAPRRAAPGSRSRRRVAPRRV